MFLGSKGELDSLPNYEINDDDNITRKHLVSQCNIFYRIPKDFKIDFITYHPSYMRLFEGKRLGVYGALVLALLDFARPKDKQRFPEWFSFDKARIINLLGGNKKTIQDCLKHLESLGIIQVNWDSYFQEIKFLKTPKPEDKLFIKYIPEYRKKLGSVNLALLFCFFKFKSENVLGDEEYFWFEFTDKFAQWLFGFDRKTVYNNLQKLYSINDSFVDYKYEFSIGKKGIYKVRLIRPNFDKIKEYADRALECCDYEDFQKLEDYEGTDSDYIAMRLNNEWQKNVFI